MALINPINNFATPVSYSNPVTPATPATRKPANLEIEKTTFVEVSPEEQQQFEAAQQKAQRAEFLSQASNHTSANNENPGIYAEGLIEPETLRKENPAITLFNELQNIEAAPRLGQEVNKFV